MPESLVKVARGLLLFGDDVEAGVNRAKLLKRLRVANNTFRDAAPELGAVLQTPGLRFFDTEDGYIRFGPGAGLVLGVSVGSGSVHAGLVDANGRVHAHKRMDPVAGQLSLEPIRLLDRIKEVVAEVLGAGLKDEALLVNGALPFLGMSVAWASPVDRDTKPLGEALHPSWLDGSVLKERVAQHLNIRLHRSHALNDAHASAIGVAWHQTRHPDHHNQEHPRMAIVMRLAGAIGGASIVVESPERVRNPERTEELGPTSGFMDSILLGGRDLHAGELGHLTLDKALIDERNANRPAGLGPLTPFQCSCTSLSRPAPDHLEAYVCTSALAHMIAPGEPECPIIEHMIKNPEVPIHKQALEDLGTLLGHALRAPVLMLNPATITLTGMLAVPLVEKTVNSYLLANKAFGNQPDVRHMDGEKNRLIRVQGAALAILRAKVHRQIEPLVGGSKRDAYRRVQNLTEPLKAVPWES